jgi:rhamnogalacturonan endolyase
MEIENPHFTRRTALGLLGGAAAAATLTTGSQSAAAAPTAMPVKILINGSRPRTGSYAFPADVDTLVLDNGLIKFTFGRDDATGGVVTGWTDTSITATSIVVDGVELAHNLNGVDPRDPDRQHSFYIDAGGGRTRLVCTEVRVLRIDQDLTEVAFVDNASSQLQHEHHLIMRRGKRGLYGYDILTSMVPQSINEVRMNARWDRSIFDHAYNWERGKGQQPTYAYLDTQTRVGDETWQIDGVNNANLPSPESNSGNLPPGTVYTKYNWSLYHHENPMFGHYGHGFGAWLTPLGGVSDQTLCAFYGAGPNHQDLAIHQDALILNYFGINHYGEPAYAIPAGYQRLYGPWFTYVTTGDPSDPDSMIAEAADLARSEIAENRSGSSWMRDPFYPSPGQRTTVTGRLRIADGRPAGEQWVLLSTQDADDVFAIHEPTYFVRTEADGTFRLPGIPPAWKPGTRTPGSYTLYIFAAGGSITDQFKRTVDISGRGHDLGDVVWAPTDRSTFLWQIGGADRLGGEFALAANPDDFSNPRSFEKPSQVPATLSWTVGTSWEPQDWCYAQANAGTWTINFDLDRVPTGTAYLTVSSSLQSGNRPTIAINGSSDGLVGTLPANNDSTIGRQADRSGFPRRATLSFPSTLLREGSNTVTLTRGGSGGGMGWDTLVLEADEDTAPAPATLAGTMVHDDPAERNGHLTWTIEVTNTGSGTANDVRLTSFQAERGNQQARIVGRDPGRFAVPITARLAPGESARLQVVVDLSDTPELVHAPFSAMASANGGRTVVTMQGS